MAKDWVPSWLRSSEEGSESKELPKELKDSIADSVKASLTPIEEKLKGLDSLTAFAQDWQKDKEAREAAEAQRAEEARRAAVAKNEPTDEDIAARLLSDPKGAINDLTKTQQELMLSIRADQVKDRVFRDRADEFPYYDGEIKKEVDKILSEQSLKFRNDESSVANAYYTVVGRRQKEINDGKIKSRFASSSTTGVNGSSKTADEAISLEMTPDMVRAAKLCGMSVEDYKALAEKAAKAGEIEYV